MDTYTMALILGAGAVGFYMAWTIGANDVANAMSTSVGAKAITLKQAVIIAAVLELVGATLLGAHVAGTISKGIISIDDIGEPTLLLYGMLSAILASALWVTLATWKELPISTSHSIVGALIGFGIVAKGASVVEWDVVGRIAFSWVLSPLMGALLAFVMFKIIIRAIFSSDDPFSSAKRATPFFLGAAVFIVFFSLSVKTAFGEIVLGGPGLLMACIYSIMVAAVAGLGGYLWVSRKQATENSINDVELVFRRLQIITSCYLALAHGANDVANAIAPLAAVMEIARDPESMPETVRISLQLLALGGIGIAVGVLTWGYKVIKTIGTKITHLTNTRGFSVDFGAATTVLIASKLGMPISTTHTVVGAVIGVGMARGLDAIDLSVIKRIAVSWVVTLPAAGLTTAGIYLLLSSILL